MIVIKYDATNSVLIYVITLMTLRKITLKLTILNLVEIMHIHGT